jgi:hypothetical protein
MGLDLACLRLGHEGWLQYSVHANKHQFEEIFSRKMHESFDLLRWPELLDEPLLAPMRDLYGRMVHACKIQGHTQSLCGHSARLRCALLRIAGLQRHHSRWRIDHAQLERCPNSHHWRKSYRGGKRPGHRVCIELHAMAQNTRSDASLQVLESNGQSMRHAFSSYISSLQQTPS